MRHVIALLGLSTVLAGTAGCGGADAGSAGTEGETSADGVEAFVTTTERNDVSLTVIDFADGRHFRIAEWAPGNVSMDEVGPVAVRPTAARVKLQDLTPLATFRAILPNAKPSPALLRAESRFLEQASKAPEKNQQPEPVADEPGDMNEGPEQVSGSESPTLEAIDDSLCPWDWFSQFLCIQGALVGARDCVGYNEGTNGNFQRNDVVTGQSVTCVYRGAVRFRVRVRHWYDWDTRVSEMVQEGYYRWYRNVSNSGDFDYETHNTPDPGAGYHYSWFSSSLRVFFPVPYPQP